MCDDYYEYNSDFTTYGISSEEQECLQQEYYNDVQQETTYYDHFPSQAEIDKALTVCAEYVIQELQETLTSRILISPLERIIFSFLSPFDIFSMNDDCFAQFV